VLLPLLPLPLLLPEPCLCQAPWPADLAAQLAAVPLAAVGLKKDLGGCWLSLEEPLSLQAALRLLLLLLLLAGYLLVAQ
jgi:hypothetical protein